MSAGRGLTVLLTNVRLDGRTGTETWLLDVAMELQRRGHRPVVYTPRPGPIAETLRRSTIPVVHDPRQLAVAPDVIHGHHVNPTLTALLAFPLAPALLFVHDWSAWHDRPVRFPRIRRIVAVDDTCADRALEAGFAGDEVQVVLNFADLGRFRPRGALPTRPRRALLLDNGATTANHGGVVAEACRRAGIALDVAGQAAGTQSTRPEALLPAYDLVFAKAKAAIEALAVGCAVVLVHAQGLGGLVTTDRYARMRRLNFGRRLLREPLSPEALLREIDRYDPDDAAAVAARLRADGSLETAVTEIVALYEAVIDEQAQAPDDAAAELTALVGYLRGIEDDLQALDHTHGLEHRCAHLTAVAEQAAATVASTEVLREDAVARHAEAEANLTAARADAAGRAAAERAAHEARLALEGLRTTRRWRLVQAALGPADRVRRRVRARPPGP